jgi:hypothetical protein
MVTFNGDSNIQLHSAFRWFLSRFSVSSLYFPYFEKIKGGLLDQFAVCVSVYVCLSICLCIPSLTFAALRLMRSPCFLHIIP